jgi:hypothetical protein
MKRRFPYGGVAACFLPVMNLLLSLLYQQNRENERF